MRDPVDSKRRPSETPRMDEDDLPKSRKDAANLLATEGLDRLSRDELDERIALLQAEIARIEAHRNQATAHRAIADALFKSN